MSKYTEDDLREELKTKEYEYGFYTDIESETFAKGLNEDVVRAISKKKNEPEWMTEWRLDAFKVWSKMEEPEWANVSYKKPEFQDIAPAVTAHFEFEMSLTGGSSHDLYSGY